jgi:hypothetical protein
VDVFYPQGFSDCPTAPSPGRIVLAHFAASDILQFYEAIAQFIFYVQMD